MKRASSLALALAFLAGTAQAANTVRLKVEDHFGNSTEQQFDIDVTAGATGATWVRVPATTLPGSNIPVPTFSVMKYEARGTTPPVSTPDGLPYQGSDGIINHNAQCASLGAGYHLITESQWQAIAYNVLGVAKNWTGGAVGSGYLMQGNNTQNYLNRLASSDDDANGYLGVTGVEKRRTLVLSNGEVIWDFAGNIKEITYCDSAREACNADGTFMATYIPSVAAPGEMSFFGFPNLDLRGSTIGYTHAAAHVGQGNRISSGYNTISRGGGGSGTANCLEDAGVFSICMYPDTYMGYRCAGP